MKVSELRALNKELDEIDQLRQYGNILIETTASSESTDLNSSVPLSFLVPTSNGDREVKIMDKDVAWGIWHKLVDYFGEAIEKKEIELGQKKIISKEKLATLITKPTTELQGKTAIQIKEAPYGSVYVWVSADLGYVEKIATLLRRTDITFVEPSWLDMANWRGSKYLRVTVDHAVQLTDRQRYNLTVIREVMNG